jgi:hypothetical protein
MIMPKHQGQTQHSSHISHGLSHRTSCNEEDADFLMGRISTNGLTKAMASLFPWAGRSTQLEASLSVLLNYD